MMRWLTLLLAVAQIVVPYLPYAGIGTPIGSGFTSPVVPAPYAFTIWLPIFATTLTYAIWQLRSHDPLIARLGAGPARAFGLCTLWSVVAIARPEAVAAQVVIFTILLGVLSAVAIRLSDWPGPAPWFAKLGFGLFAGWSTLALFANASAVIPLGLLGGSGLTPAQQAIAILCAAALLAAALAIRLRGSLGYVAAVVWGLAGVAVANAGTPTRAAGWIATGLAIVLIVLMLVTRRRPYRMSERTS